MALPARLKMRSEQYNLTQKLEKMGFAHVDNSNIGSVYEMVDGDGWKHTLVVDLFGNVKRKKPTKATAMERGRLPVVKQKYEFLDGASSFN